METRRILKQAVVLTSFAVIFTGVSLYASRTNSASLTSVSATLSNSRLSFRGLVGAGNTAGTSQLIINTTAGGTPPSNSTNQLVEGDVVGVGVVYGDPLTSSILNFTVSDLASNSTIDLASTLTTPMHTTGFDVISTSSANITVRFTTNSALSNGDIRVLVPAANALTSNDDGVPDQGGWDSNEATTADLTCPGDAGSFDFSAGTHTVLTGTSVETIDGQPYHVFTCDYTSTGSVGQSFADGIVINNMVNPAPGTSHTAGTADGHEIILQHRNSSGTVIDSTTVSVGVIEAVRVTAEVAPQITFTIAGVASSTSTCGQTTDVTTTATSVPFGELSISSFTEAAQTLTVSTNATGGYVVTGRANDQLGKDGGACSTDPTSDPDCIRDSGGNGGAMEYNASAEWTNTSAKGFGYSIHNSDAASVAFQYTTNSGNCSGSFCARQFADAENGESQTTLFSSSTVADSENINVCYRAIIPATQSAGNYENYITYIATATF